MKTEKLEIHKRLYSKMANKQEVSQSEMETDSGFSDSSSGYFSAVDQTELEDLRFSTSATQNIQPGPQVPHVPGSPMIKMNNIVLKQASSLTPSWGFHPSLEMVPQTSSVVLLQPVVPNSNCTSQISIDQQRQSNNFIPFLNSVLKMSPHPAHEAAGDFESSIINKSNSGHSHAGKRRHIDKQYPLKNLLSLKKDISENTVVGSSVDSTSFDRNMDSPAQSFDLKPHLMDSPASICTDGYSPLFPETCAKATFASSDDVKEEDFPVSLSPSLSKRKRFCNTYNILNRSGLLGITMRTKELIRQNKRSQAQLQRLQTHTDLFLEAVSSKDPQVWAKLQLTLQNPSSEEPKEEIVGNTGLNSTAIECM